MIIYRLQDKYGDGIYTSNLPHDFTRDIQECNGRHPTPYEDDLFYRGWSNCENRESYLFGFTSIEQLRNWFYRDDWLILASRNFKLCEFAADPEFTIIGYTQAAFDGRKGVCVGEYNIIEYFNLKGG